MLLLCLGGLTLSCGNGLLEFNELLESQERGDRDFVVSIDPAIIRKQQTCSLKLNLAFYEKWEREISSIILLDFIGDDDQNLEKRLLQITGKKSIDLVLYVGENTVEGSYTLILKIKDNEGKIYRGEGILDIFPSTEQGNATCGI